MTDLFELREDLEVTVEDLRLASYLVQLVNNPPCGSFFAEYEDITIAAKKYTSDLLGQRVHEVAHSVKQYLEATSNANHSPIESIA